MGKYIVTAGQNIYDVSICLYGAIEGIVDLLINNPSLSLLDKLTPGDELTYTDDFIIDKDIIAFLNMHKINSANGERHVYFKEADGLFMEAYIPYKETSTSLSFQGEGTLQIDWGDNTDIETLILGKERKEILHFFNSTVAGKRTLRLYGDVRFQSLNLDKLQASEIYLFKPLHVERFSLQNTELNIDFIGLLNGCYEMDLTKAHALSLLPLLKLKNLMEVKLNDMRIKSSEIDQYLIGLVHQYENRRNCHILLTIPPSGIYKEPQKDVNNNYILTSGMEAIWVILHEPTWNEAAPWIFTINDQIYTYEPDSERHI